MEMFLWSVGSFHVFGEKLDFVGKTLPKNPQGGFLTFQIDVRMQSFIISRVAKGFYFFEKGFYILEKGFYILEKGFDILEKDFYILEKGFWSPCDRLLESLFDTFDKK